MKVAVVNDTRKENHAGCTAVMEGLEGLLNDVGAEVVVRHPVSRDWVNTAFLKAASKSDLIVVNGEGSIHSSNFRAETLSNIGVYAAENGIASALLNCTIYNNSSSIMDRIRRFDLVACRDSFSVQICKEHGIKAVQTPDFSFLATLALPCQMSRSSLPIFTDSIVKEDQRALQDCATAMGADYMRMKGEPSPQGFVDRLARGAGVVTGRYHAVCLCINAGIPFIAIESNTPKISFLLQDVFGHTDRLVPKSELASRIDVPPYTDEELAAIERFKHRGVEQFSDVKSRLLSAGRVRTASREGNRHFRPPYLSNLVINPVSKDLVVMFAPNGNFPFAGRLRNFNTLYLWESSQINFIRDAEGACKDLTRLIKRHGFERTIFMGFSKAAYGALLWASLCAEEDRQRHYRALAFSPQVELRQPNKRLGFPSYESLLNNSNIRPDLIRFGSVRKRVRQPNLSVTAVVARGNAKDRAEAALLRGTNVKRIELPFALHNTLLPFTLDFKSGDAVREAVDRLFQKAASDRDLRATLPASPDEMIIELEKASLGLTLEELLIEQLARPPRRPWWDFLKHLRS
jgi:Uncharacterized conserved protein